MRFVATQRLPAMYQVKENVMAGGLMSYGPSLPELFLRAALYVDKILKGAKPAASGSRDRIATTRLRLVPHSGNVSSGRSA